MKIFRASMLYALIASLATACNAADEPTAEFRFWTTSNNIRSTVRLQLVELTESSVQLKREDNGKVVGLRIDQLSQADREYLRSLQGHSPTTVTAASPAANWPSFRGPGRSGIANDSVPLEWSDSRNMRWKIALPGPGASSPITFGNQVYVTCYSGYGLSPDAPGELRALQRHLICVDGDAGKILWQVDFPTDAGERNYAFSGFNALHGFATSTPVADETGVYVYFGTAGAAHVNHEGQLLWQKKLGNGIHDWGTAASPVLFENQLIVHADIEAQALVALDKRTGEEVWRQSTGGADSWSTPLLVEANGRHELVYHHSQGNPDGTMIAVDPRGGTELWRAHVLCDYLCPSPIAHDGVVYAIAHQRGAAVRAGGQGLVNDSHVLWQNQRGSEICTPVYHGGHLYFSHQENGIAYCIDARTGETVYQERLNPPARHIYASAVLADGRIYYVSRENGTYVVAAQPQFEQLAHNVIAGDDSIFNATPAVSEGRMYVRSNKHLYCIAEK